VKEGSVRRFLIACWAVLGVVALLVEPAVRLGRAALLRLGEGFAPGEWAALAGVTLVLGYVEGHRGFRCSFCPRVVDRAFELAESERSAWWQALAPLYAMSLIGDGRGRLARSWGLAAGVVFAVCAVRRLPPTARAIVDAAVAVSMVWGVFELCARYAMRVGQLMTRSSHDKRPQSPLESSAGPT
jgi:hypothetical protein